MKKLDLINSEGPLMVATKNQNKIYITDEDGARLAIVSTIGFNAILSGDIILRDSYDRDWDFPNVSKGMEATKEQIKEFLNEK